MSVVSVGRALPSEPSLEPPLCGQVVVPRTAASAPSCPAPGRWRFYYYSGLVRQTDQEIAACDKVLCYSSKEEEVCCVTQDHTGKRLGQSGGGGSGESKGRSLCCGLHGKEQVRQSKQAWQWLVGVIKAGSGV